MRGKDLVVLLLIVRFLRFPVILTNPLNHRVAPPTESAAATAAGAAGLNPVLNPVHTALPRRRRRHRVGRYGDHPHGVAVLIAKVGDGPEPARRNKKGASSKVACERRFGGFGARLWLWSAEDWAPSHNQS